jgi:predicted  nucleic acid-binding Zn-ribbon protein
MTEENPTPELTMADLQEALDMANDQMKIWQDRAINYMNESSSAQLERNSLKRQVLRLETQLARFLTTHQENTHGREADTQGTDGPSGRAAAGGAGGDPDWSKGTDGVSEAAG